MQVHKEKRMSPISYFVVHLELHKNGSNIGHGTGFIYKPYPKNEIKFLVTNYHVLTCRKPEEPEKLLPNYGDSPDEISFFTLTKPDLVPKKGSIIIDGSEQWLEHRRRNEGVDIIALPIKFPNDAIILTQEELDLVDDIEIEAGSELFIIGFPWGFGAGDFFPIWKRGTIASEPLYKQKGIAKFYIDSYTTPGMSGSPVFAISRREMFSVDREIYTKFKMVEQNKISALDLIKDLDPEMFQNNNFEKQCLKLVGIYSGRVILPEKKDPNIGIVWQKELIDELFSDPIPTKHPYPPIKVDV